MGDCRLYRSWNIDTVHHIHGEAGFMRRKTRRRIRHGVTFALIAGSIAFGVFYFGYPVALRFWQAICDFGRSIAAYFVYMFTLEEGLVETTVQQFPANMDTVLPLTWEELTELLIAFWRRFSSWKNILSFFLNLIEKLSFVGPVLALVAILIGATLLICHFLYKKPESIGSLEKKKKRQLDTKPLQLFKRFMRKLKPIYKAIRAYFVGFLAERRYYIIIFIVLWAYNLNLFTIAFEALAYVFYLAGGSGLEGVLNIIVQAAKLICDISVAWFFIPRWAWCLIGYKLFAMWRRSMALKMQYAREAKNRELIKKYPGTKLVTGKQRSKKTTILTALKRLYERLFREDAEEGMNRRMKQFPFFPWVRLEKFIDKNRKNHKIYMVYHCKKVIRFMRGTYELSDDDPKKLMRIRHLRKRYGYDFDDLLFGYEREHGMVYNDGLRLVHLFDAMEAFAQLYFIYSQRKTLNFSSYPIREDFSWIDYGNHPQFCGDMISLTVEDSIKNSQFSFIVDYDGLRPGKKFIKGNPYADAIEYGILSADEWAKERKNRITRGGGGKKEEINYATQDNDGFELDAKVRGQVALIDYKDYWVGIFDDQREGSLGADNKDLAIIWYIKGVAEEYLLMPFFELEEAFYALHKRIYDKIDNFFLVRKGCNTLLHYLVKKIGEPINKYFDRIHNRFTAHKVRLKVKDGGDGEELGEEIFWALDCETYNDIYPSDSCKPYYNYRFARSNYGMEDFPTYGGLEPTIEEKLFQNSYFVEDMTEYNGIESRRKFRYTEAEAEGGGKKNKKATS